MTTEPAKGVRAWPGRAWSFATGGLLRVSALTVLLLAVVAFGVLTLLSREVLDMWPWGSGLAGRDKDTRQTYADLVKVALAVAGGTGAAVGLVVAYRRQKHAEVDDPGKRSRYAAAAQQLGDPQAAVRLAGAYAMAHLADEWPQQRQQCVDVLCAYLRLPWTIEDPAAAEPTTTTVERTRPTGPGGHHTETRVYAGRPGEREVRRTLIRIIADHLRPGAAMSWSDLRLDLTGATLVDADLDEAVIGAGSSFDGTRFFGGTSFAGARFTGDALFRGARFGGGAWFAGARFGGGAWFAGATFTRGARFAEARFGGAASFAGARFGGDAWFAEARFTRGALLREARFGGDASFGGARFGGDAGFDKATFSGDALFDKATFTGGAYFAGATFSGDALFGEAAFEATTSWVRAELPSRAVFDACLTPPTPAVLDEAIYRDQPATESGPGEP